MSECRGVLPRRVVGLALALVAVNLAVAPRAHAAARITVVNRDGSGEGFNDATPAAPVGGNSGTTLGQQRLIAFEYAADRWAAELQSAVEIRVSARFNPLPCNAISVTLGQAGPVSVFRDFNGAPQAGTFYAAALADKLAGTDLDPSEDDIEAEFNSVFGTTCAFDGGWYYGLDGATPPNDSDLVTVVLHELGHGLGFLSLVDIDSGQRFDNRDDAFSIFLFDSRTGKTFSQMTNFERASAITATGALQWSGTNVMAASGGLLDGVDPSGRVEMYAPAEPVPGSSVSHWSDEVFPPELMAPFFTGPLHDVGLAAELCADIGWSLVSTGCPGDCNGDGHVSIDELIVAVRIALGELAVDLCSAVDTNGDGRVDVSELVSAVSRALNGCDQMSTLSPSPTPMVTRTPTATRTTPVSAGTCPLDFNDDSSAPGVPVCVFAGRWNSGCGDDQLPASFAADGDLIVAAVASDPLVGIAGSVTSATKARLEAWFTDFDTLSDLAPMSGTAELVDGGAVLRIDPDGAPFAIDGCNFVDYRGTFQTTVGGSAQSADTARRALQTLRARANARR